MAKKKTEVRIEPLDKKGQFIVHESHDSLDGPYRSPKKSAFGNHADMMKHVAKLTKPKGRPTSFKDALKGLNK